MRAALVLGAWLLWVALTVAQEATDEPTAEPPRYTIEGPESCFRLDRLNDFQVIDSRTIIVWRSNRKDPHKVSLFNGCPRLRSADAIYFDADGWDQICGRGGEYLVVTRPGIPSARERYSLRGRRSPFPTVEDELIEERCAVSKVERINDDVVHELLVEGGHALPRGPERPDEVEVVAAEEASDSDKN